MRPKYETFSLDEGASFHCVDCNTEALHKRWHYHENFELYYSYGFSGELQVGDYIGAIRPGVLYLLPPNLPHSWKGSAGVICHQQQGGAGFQIVFSETMISRAHQLFPELGDLKPMLKDARFGLEFVKRPEIVEIGKLMVELNSMEGCAKLSQFFSIIDKLVKCEYKTLSSEDFIKNQSVTSRESLSRAFDYINNNFHENISLEFVSGIANMSSSHFCRMFKKSFGVGFVDYVNNLRIEKACHLIATTERPISSVGYECGFSNISNFNRNFRKYMGISPSEYRTGIRSPASQ